VARDWQVNETINLILHKVGTIAPDNTAPIPFAFAFEDGLWHVDVMVKRPHCEYDVHSEAPDLTTALKGVYKRLGNWRMLERGDLS
jgi:hypothetical protein